uniref:Uncharacterized protein n=1 Tax=Musa acuminata TaxID=4641 RepID=Q1EP87_MUSAC|nr:hypothetical protein MA4_64C22.28 [Musa acuminata]
MVLPMSVVMDPFPTPLILALSGRRPPPPRPVPHHYPLCLPPYPPLLLHPCPLRRACQPHFPWQRRHHPYSCPLLPPPYHCLLVPFAYLPSSLTSSLTRPTILPPTSHSPCPTQAQSSSSPMTYTGPVPPHPVGDVTISHSISQLHYSRFSCISPETCQALTEMMQMSNGAPNLSKMRELLRSTVRWWVLPIKKSERRAGEGMRLGDDDEAKGGEGIDESDDEVAMGKVADVLDTMGMGGEEGEDEGGGKGDSIEDVVKVEGSNGKPVQTPSSCSRAFVFDSTAMSSRLVRSRLVRLLAKQRSERRALSVSAAPPKEPIVSSDALLNDQSSSPPSPPPPPSSTARRSWSLLKLGSLAAVTAAVGTTAYATYGFPYSPSTPLSSPRFSPIIFVLLVELESMLHLILLCFEGRI